MTRKLLCFSCILLVLVLIVSCAGTKGLSATSDPASPVYSGVRGEQPVYTFNVLDEKLQNPEGVLTLPWKENAIELAKQTGTIRFYFMSGEKKIYSETAGIKFGDSTLIVFPDGTTMLVDGGMPGYGEILQENLALLGVTKLDYVVLSHMHDDHYGGLFGENGVLFEVPVDTLLWNGSYNTSDNAKASFHRAIRSGGIDARVVQKGDSIQIGDVLVEFFNQVLEENRGQQLQETALNNASVIMKITCGDFKALFCGDLYVDGEYRAIKDNPEGTFDVDLIKANHHGRDTSNSKDWGAATTPRVVVAICGNPVDTTPYAWYSKIGARVFGDNTDGYVRVVSDGYNCEVTTSRPRNENSRKLYENYDKLVQQVYP